MAVNLKNRPEQSSPATVNVARLIKTMLSSYARAHGGSYMIVDAKPNARNVADQAPEIHCIFPQAEAAAAADYARTLAGNFGLTCQVFSKTHPELLNHLAPRATFNRERRSNSR